MSAAKVTCSSVLLISSFISTVAVSQTSLPKWEAGINAGAYMYQGDLTPHAIGSVETIRPGFGISATRIINRSLSARLLFNMANIAGDESIYKNPDWRQQRNFSFSTSIKELGLSLHWNFLATNYEDVKFQPYVFAGAAASFVNIKRDYSRVNIAYFGETSRVQIGLAADVATPTPAVIPVAPVGAGIRYHVSNRIVLNLEGTYRLAITDYLDGFSKSANPNFKDHYSSLTIGASYKFGGNGREKYGCPVAN